MTSEQLQNNFQKTQKTSFMTLEMPKMTLLEAKIQGFFFFPVNIEKVCVNNYGKVSVNIWHLCVSFLELCCPWTLKSGREQGKSAREQGKSARES